MCGGVRCEGVGVWGCGVVWVDVAWCVGEGGRAGRTAEYLLSLD